MKTLITIFQDGTPKIIKYFTLHILPRVYLKLCAIEQVFYYLFIVHSFNFNYENQFLNSFYA